MILTINFRHTGLSLKNARSYFIVFAMVAGNVLLPQLCHFLPVKNAGPVLLPIYFFTLIGAYKFGFKAGLLTAVLSPLLSSALFGMPAAAQLPVIIIKSVLLALVAALVIYKTQTLSLLHIFIVVASYQILGGLAEWAITGTLQAAMQDVNIGLPGILLQIFGGYLVLRLWRK